MYEFVMDENKNKNPKTKRRPTARTRMMDFLALRDHSEKELRQKLKKSWYEYTPEEIEKAIAYGKERNWIPESEKLSEKFAEYLHKKNKGIKYINQFLNQKGLPPVKYILDIEKDKALELASNKFKNTNEKLKTLSHEDKKKLKAKIGRFLASRGYSTEVCIWTINQLSNKSS